MYSLMYFYSHSQHRTNKGQFKAFTCYLLLFVQCCRALSCHGPLQLANLLEDYSSDLAKCKWFIELFLQYSTNLSPSKALPCRPRYHTHLLPPSCPDPCIQFLKFNFFATTSFCTCNFACSSVVIFPCC